MVDVDGLMVCKVDDVELTEFDDGVLGVTGLLAGPAALVPRYGDEGSGRAAARLLAPARRASRRTATTPTGSTSRWWSGWAAGSSCNVPRHGVLVRQGQRARRLNELLQMPVQDSDGRPLGRVLDVRLEHETIEPGERIRVTGLVVGRGRPGSYLGYDRRPDMGPWLVSRIVRWLHRHSGYVALDDLDELDWDAGVIRVRDGALGPLVAAES